MMNNKRKSYRSEITLAGVNDDMGEHQVKFVGIKMLLLVTGS